MEFIIIVGLIAILFYFNARISRLEKRLSDVDLTKQSFVPNSIPSPIPQAGKVGSVGVPVSKESSRQQGQHSTVSRFINWVKQDFMVKVGALLLLLALGWFVSYAFAENWIGPAGRISLGLLFGAVFLVLGTWRISVYRHQGGIFMIIGATTTLLTIFAARELYDFFTPLSALVLMFMTVVFVAFVSVRYQSEKLAFAGLVLGSFAPLLTSAPIPDTIERFTYLMVVALGTLWVVWVTGWTRLTLASLVITYLYSLPYFFGGYYLANQSDKDIAITFSFLFVSLFFVANMVSLVRRHGQGLHHMKVHTLTALGTGIFLFTWIEAAASIEWRSLLYVAWALVFAVGTYAVYLFTANQSAFYLYGATSVALIGVATAAELHGPALTIAYLLEISLLLIAAGKLMMGTKLLSRLSLLLVVPVSMSLESFDSYNWRDSIMHEDFVVIILTASILFMVAIFFLSQKGEEESGLAKSIPGILFATGGLYVIGLIWLVSHALLENDLATMLSLAVYTVVGITFFVQGKLKDRQFVRLSGAALITLVVVRLLFVDIWDMDLEGRIVTFLVIGIMLISTAFIRKLHPSDQVQSDNNPS
ncbi:MAG: putative membrane protein [Candidatus Paceibacteria bacterium]|jgi:uncharacterized membrane protein